MFLHNHSILALAILLLFMAAGIAFAIYSRWIIARPNEWLLVIDNGQLKTAGIGLSVFRGIGQTTVRFPSSIQKVPFKAQQVTKEMQGIEVTGFVIWVINREGDGPFKAYKYLDGLKPQSAESPKANENIARMAESIIRHQVANLSINEVITQREVLRNKTRQEMLDVVKGWGVWLETVEITDVSILSKSLFEDLQTPFRQETRRIAERIRINAEQEIQQQRVLVNLELGKQQADAKTQQAVYEAQKQLEKEQEEEKLFVEQQRIQKRRLEQEKELTLLRVEDESLVKRRQDELAEERERYLMRAAVEREALAREKMQVQQETQKLEVAHSLGLEREKAEQELALLARRLEVESAMKPVNVSKAILESIKELYRNLPLESVKIVNIGTNQGFESVIAQLAAAIQETSKQLQEATGSE